MTDELLELEIQTWRALSSADEGAAVQFLDGLLHEDAAMLFPGGMRLSGKARILDSIAAQPWKHFEIHDPHAFALGDDAGVLTYRVTAQREGAPPYAALVSSVYVRVEGAWRLIVHQHTPE